MKEIPTFVAGLTIILLSLLLLPVVSSASNVQELENNLFPRDKVIDVKITIAKEDFNEMLNNPLAEEYKAAKVDYNGYVVDNVAIRTKGNSSLTSVARMDSDRYSFKISFDQYIAGQHLFGLKKINLNNNFSDPSYLREFLSYELLKEMSVPTPEVSFVNVYINEELWGLYLAVEQIDTPFLARYFSTAVGSLYKPEGDGSDLLWRGDTIESYSGLNVKSKSSNDEAILALINELNNGVNYDNYLDVDGFLRYLAVSTVLTNLDSYQGNFKHNYYLYEENGRFSVLPWDLNMSFAGFNMGMTTEQLTGLYIDEPTMGRLEERPLISKLLQQAQYKQIYHHYIEEVVSGYLAPEYFEERLKQVSSMISVHVKNDPTKFYTFEEHLASLYEDVQGTPGLMSFVSARVENVGQQLTGELASVGTGEGLALSMGQQGNRQFPEQRLGRPENAPEGFQGGGESPPTYENGNFLLGDRQGPIGPSAEQQSAKVTGDLTEAIKVGVLLILLVGVAIFIAKYKKN